MAGGNTPPETATFSGYLAGVVLVPVAGALWARTEQTRWAGTVIAVAAAVVGVMVWRLVPILGGGAPGTKGCGRGPPGGGRAPGGPPPPGKGGGPGAAGRGAGPSR